jgi:hypothetical protein
MVLPSVVVPQKHSSGPVIWHAGRSAQKEAFAGQILLGKHCPA